MNTLDGYKITIVFLCLTIIVNILTIIKNYKIIESLKKVNSLSSNLDYEKVFKFLNILIEEEINETKNIIIPTISTKKDVRMFIEEDLNELILKNVESITSLISKDYINSLNIYLNDLDSYIINKLRKEYDKILIEENLKKVGYINIKKNI